MNPGHRQTVNMSKIHTTRQQMECGKCKFFFKRKYIECRPQKHSRSNSGEHVEMSLIVKLK